MADNNRQLILSVLAEIDNDALVLALLLLAREEVPARHFRQLIAQPDRWFGRGEPMMFAAENDNRHPT